MVIPFYINQNLSKTGMRRVVYKTISVLLVFAFVLNYGDVLFLLARNSKDMPPANSGCACAMPVCCCGNARTMANNLCKDGRTAAAATQPGKPGLAFVNCGSSDNVPVVPLHKPILANASHTSFFYFPNLVDMMFDLKTFQPTEVTRSVFHPPNLCISSHR